MFAISLASYSPFPCFSFTLWKWRKCLYRFCIMGPDPKAKYGEWKCVRCKVFWYVQYLDGADFLRINSPNCVILLGEMVRRNLLVFVHLVVGNACHCRDSILDVSVVILMKLSNSSSQVKSTNINMNWLQMSTIVIFA